MTFPPEIPNVSLTNDLLILVGVGATTIIGSMIGSARLKLLTMSMYVGVGVAMLAIPLLHSIIGSPGSFLALVNLKFLAFGICIGVLGLTGGNAYHAGRKSGVINLVTAALSGLLLVTLSFMLLDPGARDATLSSSAIASMLYDMRLLWLLGAPVLLMVGGLMHGKRH